MTDWQTIVDRHKGLVWRTANRLLGGDPHEAADCFQDTFLAALELRRREPVRHWPALLQQLATRRALDRLRSRIRAARRNDPADCDAMASPAPGPSDWAEASELAARLREALARLPQQQAEVFCLRTINELSYRDIARQLDLKTSAVGVLLHRARSRLRELLGPAPAARDSQETEVSS